MVNVALLVLRGWRWGAFASRDPPEAKRDQPKASKACSRPDEEGGSKVFLKRKAEYCMRHLSSSSC